MSGTAISPSSKNRERRSTPARLKLFFAILSLLVLIFQITNYASELPDYESYMFIYENSALALVSGWDPAFVGLAFVVNALGLSYEGFRGVVALISIASLLAAFGIIRKVYVITSLKGQSNFLHLVILVACLPIFYLEFFAIRIRGGISLSLAVLSLSFFLSYVATRKKSGLLMAAVIFVFAYFCHAFTASALVLMLFAPAALSAIKIRPDEKKIKAAFLVVAIALIIALIQNNSNRGEHLFSELNIYRLLAISAFPLLLAMMENFQKQPAHAMRLESQLDRFVYYLRFPYLSLSLILVPAYLLGFVDQAGEAIVRIFTLSSIIAIIGILFSRSGNKLLWSYLLLSNSAFFVNTIYSSPYA